MFFGSAIAIALLSVPLAGGRLLALADVRLRAAWLVLAGLAIQVIVISVAPGGAAGLHRALHIGSYLLLAAMLAANLDLPYLWLVGIGGLCNFAAIVANGGVMPASASAFASAGRLPEAGEFINSAPQAHPHLLALGDVFAIPAPIAHSVFSIGIFSVGDVLIALGGALTLHALCGSRIRRLTPAVG